MDCEEEEKVLVTKKLGKPYRLWANQLKRAREELGDSRLRTLRNAQSYDTIRQSALLVRIRSVQLNLRPGLGKTFLIISFGRRRDRNGFINVEWKTNYPIKMAASFKRRRKRWWGLARANYRATHAIADPSSSDLVWWWPGGRKGGWELAG